MKTKLLTLLLLGGVALAACKPNYSDHKLSILTPTGAPAAAFYDFATSENYIYETNSVPSNVGIQLQNDSYDAVVFDFYNGLKSIKNNETQYKLARIITGGNLYLVGINRTSEPTSENPGYIVSFGENLLPDLVYKNLYSEQIINATHYVSGVADAGAVLETGLHQGNQVDYVLVAQPVLFAKLNSSPIKSQLTVVASLREKWEDKTGQKAIPQAGLFIDSEKYELYPSKFVGFFAELDDAIDTCIEDPTTMKNGMDDYGDNAAQQSFFGFTSQVAFNVQKNFNNGFAFVSSEDSDTISIEDFLTALGKGNEDYSNYIL